MLEEEAESFLNIEDLLTKKDKKLFSAYIGPNYERITDDRFNYAAFLFGGSYFIYRKVYVIGIALQCLALGACVFLPLASVKPYIIILFELILSICSGLFANQIILNDVASKIIKLKISNVPNIKEELKRIGGVNVIAFVISFIVLVYIYESTYYGLFIELLKLIGLI